MIEIIKRKYQAVMLEKVSKSFNCILTNICIIPFKIILPSIFFQYWLLFSFKTFYYFHSILLTIIFSYFPPFPIFTSFHFLSIFTFISFLYFLASPFHFLFILPVNIPCIEHTSISDIPIFPILFNTIQTIYFNVNI